MTLFRTLPIVSIALTHVMACASDDTPNGDDDAGSLDASTEDAGADASSTDAGFDAGADAGADAGELAKTVLDLADVAANPEDYEWFDFRPNLKKLILSGAAETEHIAVLWYMIEEGAVALHYHSKTESVYVIDGTQTDAKGTYTTGTVYFNPPGSGHEISDSSGFFLLAYASPPDFMSTDLIEEYTPIRLDTDDPDFTSEHPFEEQETGIATFAPELDSEGGMSAQLIETTASSNYDYSGNYVLVLEGSCAIDGEDYEEDMIVVAPTVEPEAFEIAAATDSTCLALAVSF